MTGRSAGVGGSAWSPPDEFGEYRLVRLLGAGAMGHVYLAHDVLLDRPVAVKFVHGAETSAARARIIDEARAVARLAHPNVVAIYRVAEVAGHPYLVTEYVRGRALDQLELPVRWQQVLEIALDLARGLAAAHRRGVLHRDVKPANAVLTEDGRTKLLDFGLARVMGGTAEHLGAALLQEPPSDRGRCIHCLATVDAPPAAGDRSIQGPIQGPIQGHDSTISVPVADGRGAELDPVAPGRSDPRRRMAGTPLYMAPEIWCGDPATRQTDLYSLGIVLYELLTGRTPHLGGSIAELAVAALDRDIPRLRDLVPGVEPALAAVIERLVQRDPRARFATADALLVALEAVAAPPALGAPPDGNPYRGLAVFESAHRALFFGRRREIRELVDRVTIEAFVVVGGDSGTGKSSLCRAGVLPWIARCAGWSCAAIVPGRHPVQSLAAALAAWTATDEAELAATLRDDPDAVARAIRRHGAACASPARHGGAPRRLLLVVDQLEELLTLAEPEEARMVAAALAVLTVQTGSLHVLATAHADFLTRLAMLPDLGDEVAPGLYFLRPLAGEHMRDVIVRPAAARGVAYESEALIDALIEQTEHAPGGLPLLQFTLAELWDARDAGSRVVRAETLAALGGVGGALARHADRVIAALGRDARAAARRILLRLVTAEGTRARRSEAELFAAPPGPDAGQPGPGLRRRDAERAALEALVRGRIVVANDAQGGAYELAHEALLTSWSTLLGWRQLGAADRARRERIEHAAAAWERTDRARELLWGPRQLAQTRSIDRASLAPRDAAFLDASRRAIRTRRIIAGGGAAVLAIGAVLAGVAIAALGAPACAPDGVATSSAEQASTVLAPVEQQGRELQGTQLQGRELQGRTLRGFQLAGASLGGAPLRDLRVEAGELVAEQDQATLRGVALVGAHLYAQVGDPEVDPPVARLVEYRITDITGEDPKYDPTSTGSTFLYTLEQNVDHTGSWQPACGADLDGRGVAIPLAATWNTHGDRVESSALFTFGCTTGVIAKCYRWGYRPWVTGYGDLAAMHWACTRLARADYCGDGVPHTEDGTWVNVWDDLPAPGPIQDHGARTPDGMHFEAAWNTDGAVCVSRTRWKPDMKPLARTCLKQRILGGNARKFCDTVDDAHRHGLTVLLFNESFDDPLHPHLPN